MSSKNLLKWTLASIAAMMISLFAFDGEVLESPTATASAHAARLSVWSEFIPYAELEARLDEIASRHLQLFVAFNSARPDFEGFAKLVRAAKDKGVPLRPWLLIPVEDGYWFNKWNVEKNADYALEFIDEMEKRNAKPDWVIFDLEPPPTLLKALEHAFAEKSFGKVLDLLRKSANSGSLVEATRKTNELVSQIHARGIKVHAVTTNFVLNDSSHRRIQNALGTPVAGVPWDEVSFMVYRPELEKALGKGLGSKIVALYAKRARKLYGERAAIDIGEAGHVLFPTPFEGFTQSSQLHDDIAAVQAGGLSEIHVYSLDGMSERGLDYWLTPQNARPIPTLDAKAFFFMKGLSLIRNLLPPAR